MWFSGFRTGAFLAVFGCFSTAVFATGRGSSGRGINGPALSARFMPRLCWVHTYVVARVEEPCRGGGGLV